MTAATQPSQTPALSAGDAAPAFNMPVDANTRMRLADFTGKKNVVLYFYPKDDTPGCTLEAKEFKEMLPHFETAETVVIGVSKDSLASHEKFRHKFCLPFPLASDEDGAACEAYGTWGQKSMYGKTYMGIDRATFLIDKNGVVRKAWRKVKVDGHVAEVLAAAQAL